MTETITEECILDGYEADDDKLNFYIYYLSPLDTVSLEVSACMHPYVPFDARYQGAVVNFELSASKNPFRLTPKVQSTESLSTFQVIPNNKKKGSRVVCKHNDDIAFIFTIINDTLPDWLSGVSDEPIYVAIRITYDEERTIDESEISKLEIEKQKEKIQKRINNLDNMKIYEYNPYKQKSGNNSG